MHSCGVIHKRRIFLYFLSSVTKKGTDTVGNLGKDFLNKQIEKT